MRLPSVFFNNLFKSAKDKTPKALSIDELKKAKKLLDCGINQIISNTSRDILEHKNASKFVRETEGVLEILPKNLGQKLAESVKDIGKIPIGVLNSVSEQLNAKFPNTGIFKRLDNSGLLKWYKGGMSLRREVSALEGMYENGSRFLSKYLPEGKDISLDGCDDVCKSVCAKVKNDFNKILNESMGFGKPEYGTKYERFWTRIVSGFTVATFLYNDYLNKAKMKDKTGDDAVKYANQKQKQEIIANLGEALVQFTILGVCAKAANTNKMFAPVVGAAIGFSWNILSRLMTKTPLTKIPVPEKSPAVGSSNPFSMEEFNNSVKKAGLNVTDKGIFLPTHPNTPLSPNNAIVQSIIGKTNNNNSGEIKKEKKHILTLKNIALACVGIIAAGFTLRFAKGKLDKTSIGKNINKSVKSVQDWFKGKTIENVYASADEIKGLRNVLEKIKESNLSTSICDNTEKEISKLKTGQKLLIGTRLKTIKPLGIEVPVKKLYEALLAPFKFVKDVVTYPYKIAKQLAETTGLIKKPANKPLRFKVKNPETLKMTPEKLQNTKQKLQGRKLKLVRKIAMPNTEDRYDFKNIFLKFKEYQEKQTKAIAKNKPFDLTENFGAYVKKMRLISNSNNSSKLDNSASGVIAQTLGAMTGIGFNMTDERNNSINLGKTEEEADKDSKIRGINKFYRMLVQGTIIGVMNGTFAKQYNGSLLKAAGITFSCTILTDIVCRALTGMPFSQMSKEEQIAYKKKQEQGPLKWYFKLIDKLSD